MAVKSSTATQRVRRLRRFARREERRLLARASAALRRLGIDLREIVQLARSERLTALVGWLLALMLLGSLIFLIAEGQTNPNVNSYADALYWSVISVTTVGYGDLTPVSWTARAYAIIMLLSFMALMPLVGATITSIYVSKKLKGGAGLDRTTESDHILICGWNNSGLNVLAGLQELGEMRPVVIVADITPDHFENIVEATPALHLRFVKGPHTSESVLQRANVRMARIAIVLISYGMENTVHSDEQSVLAVLALRELGPNLRIVAECFAAAYRGHLRRAGADRVIVSGETDSFMLTAAALSPGLDTSIKDALTFGKGSDMWTARVPPEFHGKTFSELSAFWLTEKRLITIGLIRERKQLGIKDVLTGDTSSIDEFIVGRFEQAGRGMGGEQHLHYLNPGPDHIIQPDDLAIVIYPAEEQHA